MSARSRCLVFLSFIPTSVVLLSDSSVVLQGNGSLCLREGAAGAPLNSGQGSDLTPNTLQFGKLPL